MAKSESTKNEKVKKSAVSKTESVKRPTKKEATDKEKTTKKSATKKATTSKETATKKESTKKASASKETATKKVATKKATEKGTTTTKKSTAKKTATSKKSTTSRRSSSSTKRTSKKTAANIIEYYDLPATYNQTTVKLLFQTPKKLFVYWEISEADKQKYFAEKGNDFFEATTPYLIVKNKTKNYSFEVEINDFANSWYFDVPDSNCEYTVDLVRKFNNVPIQISSSNELEVPNNHILFEQNRKEIFFKNVKTNHVISKNVANLHLINYIGISKPVTLNAFYNKFYDEKDFYAISNPTSHL